MRVPSASSPALPSTERRVAGLILLGFLLAVALPYLLIALILPHNEVWGGLLGSADDQNVHLMWARQAKDGAFFFRDLYTTEGLTSGDKALFFNILPALMGWLSKLTTLDVVFPYHFLRVALAGWALWQFHELALALTNREDKWSRPRLLALFLLAFTTGAGVLASLLSSTGLFFIDRPDGNFPLMPEAFFALSAFAYPLNIASYGLLALVFRKIIEKHGAGVAFVGALLLSNIHTYDALPLLVTAAIWLVWKRQGSKVLMAAIGGALLPVLYQFIVFRGSEEFRIKALTVTAPPGLPSMLIAFAPLLVFALFGTKKWKEFPAVPLLLIWVGATFALVYAPTSIFSFARKMIEGVQIPLALLAGLGLSELLAKIQAAGTRKMVAGAILAVLALSPLQYLGWIWNNAIENNASRGGVLMPPLALFGGQAEALQILNAKPEQGAVLCLPFMGSYVPRATGKFTYAGHWAETLNFEKEKLPRLARFYRKQMSEDEGQAFLRSNHIRWVVVTPYEQKFYGAALGDGSYGLKPIWNGGDAENGTTVIYEVS